MERVKVSKFTFSDKVPDHQVMITQTCPDFGDALDMASRAPDVAQKCQECPLKVTVLTDGNAVVALSCPKL